MTLTEQKTLSLMDKWRRYRDSRRGTYEFRSRTRYAAVYDRLAAMGLRDGATVLDVGAGSLQFGRYLADRGWQGKYIPVDAVLDGTDLDDWESPVADFIVCIEVLEHLRRPGVCIRELCLSAVSGVVITTPNCEAVDVLGCDPTHISVVELSLLESYSFTVERHGWFGVPNDSLLAYRRTP